MNRNIQDDISHWNLRNVLWLLKKLKAREEKFLRYRIGLEERNHSQEELETNILSFLNIKSLTETAEYFNISVERAQVLELKLKRQLSGYIHHKNRSLQLKELLEE